MNREDIIQKYFESWLQKDSSGLKEIFHPNAIYIESYGPAYRGINEILQWFNDWNKSGSVLRWDIKRFVHDGNNTVCEWCFECEYNGNADGFNGVSWITFEEQDKIIELKEFVSKTPNNYPYSK